MQRTPHLPNALIVVCSLWSFYTTSSFVDAFKIIYLFSFIDLWWNTSWIHKEAGAGAARIALVYLTRFLLALQSWWRSRWRLMFLAFCLPYGFLEIQSFHSKVCSVQQKTFPAFLQQRTERVVCSMAPREQSQQRALKISVPPPRGYSRTFMRLNCLFPTVIDLAGCSYYFMSTRQARVKHYYQWHDCMAAYTQGLNTWSSNELLDLSLTLLF